MGSDLFVHICFTVMCLRQVFPLSLLSQGRNLNEALATLLPWPYTFTY